MSELTVEVLGQLEVSMDGRAVQLTTGRLRTLLTVLAIRAGRTISMDRLATAVWGEDLPANPRRSLQTYAGRLRTELGDERIGSQPAGLVLLAEPDRIDALRFEQLLDDAAREADPDRERKLLGEALDLWRGEPFEGVTSRWLAETEAPRLVERHLTALERRLDLDLAAGLHGELVGELNEWTARYPMRESLWVRLLIALNRSGRRADALERYLQLRLRIADELGVDPSPELQQVYADLLTEQPAAAVPAPAWQDPVTVPQQLPAPPPAFTGRGTELAQLERLDDPSAVVITAIDGMAGVGKTALAVQTAHRLAGRYPDGQLFLDLHGFTQGVAPVEPGEALGRLLRALGIPGEEVPLQLDDRAALYRSRLADHRMLILLDNAATEAQVGPLLPGSPGCLVLVTSRRRLSGLDQTHAVSLDLLPQPDAIALFTDTAGTDRLAGEPPQALAETVELCGRLPLAIRIAAARLRSHRTWTVRHLIDRLRDHQQRLTELEAGERSIVAALDLSYQQLTAAQQRAYRLIALHPGPDLTIHAAAALLDEDLPEARRRLDQLRDAHLLLEPTPDRYQFHDLIRQHAALAVTRDEPADRRHAALHQLFSHYAHTAAVAMNVSYPFEPERRPEPRPTRHPVPDLPTAERATGWIEAEMANLLATARYTAEHGWLDYPPLLAVTLDRHVVSRGRMADAETFSELALPAARTTGDHIGQINALLCLGFVHRRSGRHAEAETDYRQVLELADAAGYRPGELDALVGLGHLQRWQCDFAAATSTFTSALEIASAVDYPTGELEALLALGQVHRERNQCDIALEYLYRGLAMARATGHLPCELDALVGLGWIHLAKELYERAAEDFDAALRIARAGGYRIGELSALLGRGNVCRQQGRYEAAIDYYQQVLSRSREINIGNWIYEALQALGRTRLCLDQPVDALACHAEALEVALPLGQPVDVARAHDGVAHSYRALGQHDDARRHWRQALEIFTGLGVDSIDDRDASATNIREHLARYDD